MRFLTTLLASLLGTLVGLGLLFFFGFLFVIALASTSDQAPSIRPGSVVVAKLSGTLPELVSGDPISQAFGNEPSLSLHDVTKAFRMAAGDDRVDGVWLRLGNISASWASLEALRREIVTLQDSGKTVYASTDNYYLAEDELYLASAADSILLEPESLVEFNGFALQLMFYKRLMDKAGVEPQIVRAGRFKSAVEPYTRESMSPENREQLQTLIDGIDTHFVRTVAEARGLDETTVRASLQAGDVMTARDALAAGLVDGLLFSDEVESLFGDDVRTISLKRYARSSSRAAGVETGTDGEVAVVYAAGQMVPGKSSGLPGGSASLGAETFVKAMKSARESDRVDAIVVRVNSPGGFAPAADAMLREIRLAQEDKPVIISMGDVAASGGYWIAAPADTIVAEALTLTGSIGVFGMMLDFSGLLEDEIGITFDEVKTAPAADMTSGVRGLSQRERAALEASVDQTYDRFLEIVSDGRGLTTDEVDALAQGRVWTGEEALSRGLVDVLGGLDTAISIAADRAGLVEGTYRTRDLPRPQTFLEIFSEQMEAKVMGSRISSWMDRVPAPIASAVSKLTELGLMTTGVQARLPFQVQIN